MSRLVETIKKIADKAKEADKKRAEEQAKLHREAGVQIRK